MIKPEIDILNRISHLGIDLLGKKVFRTYDVGLMKRRLFRYLDLLFGGSCIKLFSLHRKLIGNVDGEVHYRRVKKILLIKLIGLGDIILLHTVLSNIRNALPETEIHFLTTPNCAMVFRKNCPYVDKVIVEDILQWKNPLISIFRLAWKLKEQHYDRAIDFEQHFYLTPILLYLSNIPRRAGFYYYSRRSELFTDSIQISTNRHMLLDFFDLAYTLVPQLEVIRGKLVSPIIKEENRIKANEWLVKRGLHGKPFVIIHPGCGPSGLCRAWPKERFAEVAVRLVEKGFLIFLSGTPMEQPIIDFIIKRNHGTNIYSLVGELEFYDYVALLDEASLLLTNDTGPMHLGAALKVPTLSLFGPENPERYKPYGDGNEYLYVKQPCSPCNHNYRGVRPDCRDKTFQKCMLEISVDMVESKIEEMIG